MSAMANTFDSSTINDSLLNKLKRVFTSAFLLLSAYLLANLVMPTYIYIVCKLLGYKTQFGYHWVVAKPFDVKYWGSIRVVLIYAMAPLLTLFLAFIIQRLVFSKMGGARRSKLFFYWLQTSLINIFLTQVFIIPVGIRGGLTGTYHTFSIVGTWFGWPSAPFVITTVLAGALAILWGLFTAPIVNSFSFSSRLISTASGKDSVMRQVYLFPIFVAAPFIAVFSNKYSFMVHLVSLVLLLFPMLGMVIRHRTDNNTVLSNREDVLNDIPLLAIAGTTVLWALTIFFFNR